MRFYKIKFNEREVARMAMLRGLMAGLAQVGLLAALLLVPAGLVPGAEPPNVGRLSIVLPASAPEETPDAHG